MPEFMTPAVLLLWLLVPAFLILYIWVSARKNKRGMRFTNTGVLAAVVPRQSQWVRHLAVALSLIALTALVGAAARPLGVEKVPRERATIILVMDISQSMQAVDVRPTRVQAAKQAATSFVKSLPAGFNVSIVALWGTPNIAVPPTVDRGAVERVINALQLKDSTAIGDGILVALQSLEQAPKGEDGSVAPGAIVLLSDGQNTAGSDPGAAAAAAKEKNVPVFTIAYGTPMGYVDIDGRREPVPPDTQLLQQIANSTGGAAYTAESVGQLDDVYRRVRSEVGSEEVKKEITASWALYGLVAAGLAALGAVLLGARKL